MKPEPMNLPLVEFAPMEGITDGIYRSLHQQFFGCINRYYTPFLSPTGEKGFTAKELRVLQPVSTNVIPQLLTKKAEDFCMAAKALCDLGFTEVNLNLGCPSGTVTAKGKGSALLGDPDVLQSLLDGIFSKVCCPVSVKTRIGLHDPNEFDKLLDIYQQYPICRLVIHPRTKDELYRGAPHLEVFDRIDFQKLPISCNGSFRTAEEIRAYAHAHPSINTVMIGRGLLTNPAMARELHGGSPIRREELRKFMQALTCTYMERFHSDRNTAFRMKELWFYVVQNFQDFQKPLKQIQKAKNTDEIAAWGNILLSDYEWLTNR